MAFCRLHDRIVLTTKSNAGWTYGLKQADAVVSLHDPAKLSGAVAPSTMGPCHEARRPDAG